MGKRQYKQLWKAVKRLIRENYKLISERSIRGIRGSKGIRGSYYIIGDLLYPLVGKEITMEDYNWFLTKQGYATYRDDVWIEIEQKDGLTRPLAKPIGVVYDEGKEYPISHLEIIWDQARAFIFVEKAGDASAIQELSDYGYTIVAGQGYPTRLMRKLLKNDKRIVLVLHDLDHDGKGIYRALGLPTRRTKHLDIAMGERVIDLGLTEKDVKALKLPTRPSPPKYKGEERVELSGLEVLSLPTRMGIDNPILAYTVAKLLAMGLKLSPTEVDKMEMMKRHIRWALTKGLKGIVEEAVEEIVEEIEDNPKFEGTAVKGELEDLEILAEGLKEKLVESGLTQAEKTNFLSEDDIHEEAVEKLANEELTRILAS